LQEKHTVTQAQGEKSVSFKDVFDIDIANSPLPFTDEKRIIADAINKDHTKTG